MKRTDNQTDLGLWWSKLGKWQTLTAAITLATFFVALALTGNQKTATATVVFAAVIAFAAATFAFAIYDKKPGLGWKVVLTSCLVEFLVIYISILLVG